MIAISLSNSFPYRGKAAEAILPGRGTRDARVSIGTPRSKPEGIAANSLVDGRGSGKKCICALIRIAFQGEEKSTSPHSDTFR